ncbi:MAG: ATP-binding protein [Candidatus Methanomethylophilaceae archaeon]
MLYGRERELLELESRYGSGRFEFLSIYGRKRVGKTALVREFLKGHEGLFFTARNIGSNVDALASAVFGSGVSAPMESILEEIKRRSSSGRYVLVIDEYPRIVRRDRAFRDHLRKLIDDIRGDSKLFLILCGSSMGIMENEMSRYGSHTGSMKLLPLDVWDSMNLLEGFSREDALRIYGMVGGIPLYLNLFDPDISLEENVVRLFIKEFSFFRNEHLVLFMEEVGGPFTHHGVLKAIASGNIRVGDIADFVVWRPPLSRSMSTC